MKNLINKNHQEELNKVLVDFAANFSDIVKEKHWISRYDAESDSLSISAKDIPQDARLHYFNDEFALYVSGKNKINGLFIEYFLSNFLSHQKEFRGIKRIISASIRDNGDIQEIKSIEKSSYIKKFQNVLLDSIAKDVSINKPFRYGSLV